MMSPLIHTTGEREKLLELVDAHDRRYRITEPMLRKSLRRWGVYSYRATLLARRTPPRRGEGR